MVLAKGAARPLVIELRHSPRDPQRDHQFLACTLLVPPMCLVFFRPHLGRQHGRKRMRPPASLGWVSGCASLSAKAIGWKAKPVHRPNRVGWFQLLLDEPIHRLDKHPRRFTLWRSCKCSVQNSPAPWMSLTRTPQLSTSCAVRLTWPCTPPRLVVLERHLWLNLTEIKDA